MKQDFHSIVDHYNMIAADYDDAFEFCNGNSLMIREMIESFLAEQLSGRLLDIGCGTGLASAPLASPNLRIFGLDGALNMLRAISGKNRAHGFVQADLNGVPFPFSDNVFDQVIANGVFCFFPNLDRMFQETGRILKPGGYFCFTVERLNETRPKQLIRSGLRIFRHDAAYLNQAFFSAGLDLIGRRDFRGFVTGYTRTPIFFTACLCRKK